jgi:hypothetical protein
MQEIQLFEREKNNGVQTQAVEDIPSHSTESDSDDENSEFDFDDE